MPRASKPPAYCKHKASRQAIVTLNGKDVYLGSVWNFVLWCVLWTDVYFIGDWSSKRIAKCVKAAFQSRIGCVHFFAAS
jgi:hypothetical protein